MPARSEIQQFAWSEAVRLAIDLMSYSGNTFPADGRIINLARARLTSLVVEFAVHARRCLDETRSVRPKMKRPLRKVELPAGAILEEDLRETLNRIIHADELEFGGGECPESLRFETAGNIVIALLITKTDHKPRGYTDIHDMAWTFLLYAHEHEGIR